MRTESFTTSPSTTPDRLLRRPEVEAMTAMSCAAIYAKMHAGRFPCPVPIGTGPRGAVAWRLSDIQKWIESRPIADPKDSDAG